MSEHTDEAVALIQRSGLSDGDKARLCRLLRLLDKSSEFMDGPELAFAREAAGLSKGQACRMLGVTRGQLEALEDEGYESVAADFPATAVQIDAVYGLGPRPEVTRFL